MREEGAAVATAAEEGEGAMAAEGEATGSSSATGGRCKRYRGLQFVSRCLRYIIPATSARMALPSICNGRLALFRLDCAVAIHSRCSCACVTAQSRSVMLPMTSSRVDVGPSKPESTGP